VSIFTRAGNDRVRGDSADSGLRASLGAGNDVASLGGAGGTLLGGAGADRLTSTASYARLEGGAGADVLTGNGALSGGPGDDVLRGGPSDDELAPGAGRDRVEGGAGRDTVVYRESEDVRVDLRRDAAWTRDGKATLRTIERAATGAGDDVLIGDGAANTLDGGPGSNVILAGDGADTLSSLGPGSACGRGRDTVRVAEISAVEGKYDWEAEEERPPTAAALTRPIPFDCERADLASYAVVVPRPRVHARRVEIALAAPPPDADSVWHLRSGWRPHGRLLGRATEVGRHRVVISLNARGRACIAAGTCRASLSVNAAFEYEDDGSSGLPLVL
jgi:Ca2+-binding RTX toxin-like protein